MNELDDFYSSFKKSYAVCSQLTWSQDFLCKKYSYERKELVT